MEDPKSSVGGLAGFSAMVLSAIALIAVVAQLAAGPFAPQPTVEDSVADLIVGVKDAVERRARGEAAPPPEPGAWDVDRVLIAAAIGMAGIAMLLGVVALARKEPRLPALLGFSLGAGTLFVVWLQWIAFAIVGVLLIAVVIFTFGGDFSL